MEPMEVNIVAFINPHFFFITEAVSKHRANFLHDMSARIKQSHVGLQNDCFIIDEIVAAYYESDLVRAKIIKTYLDVETNKTIYFCWLIDYGNVIETEKIFKLPKEIQKATPRVKQACLNDFCYVKDQLELGVTGKIKSVPSVIPSSGVTHYCLELLSNYSKLVFKVVERYNNVLIGEVLIYKNDKIFYLTEELCNSGLIIMDELIFQRVKYSTTDYMRTHLETVQQICKTQKIASPVSHFTTNVSCIQNDKTSSHSEIEEIDIDNLQVLENGRRRRGLRGSLRSSPTSGSEDDQGQKKHQSKAASLRGILKQTEAQRILNEKDNLSQSVRVPNESQEKCEDLNLGHLEEVNISLNKTLDTHEVVDIENSDSLATRMLTESDQSLVNVTVHKENSPTSLKSEKQALSKIECALQKIKELQALKEAKRTLEATQAETRSDTAKKERSSDDTWKKLVALRLRKKCATSSSARSEEGFDSSCESSLEDSRNLEENLDRNMSTEVRTSDSVVGASTSETDTKKSPFGDITSQRKVKPVGLFLPGGMEGSYGKRRQNELSKKTTKGKSEKEKKPHIAKMISSSTPDDDCPTVKVPKPSGNLTDDQISAGEVEDKPEKEKEEESSSSNITSREIFTKQDFCRLVAGCTCIKCRVALEDDDWDAPLKFESSEGEKKKSESAGPVIKPLKLLRKDSENETFVQENEILSIDYSGMSIMEKKMSCKVHVHGESIPNPIKRIAQVNIHRDIYNNINRLNYKEAKRIQHYAFPAITRNQHIFMINDVASGKTMAYLPILSSFIMEKDERYNQLFKMGGGPIVVIVCSNSKKCEEVYDLTKLIFDRQRCRVSLVTYPGHGNISNVDILITMPTILNVLISTRATNFKRLCHFVLEDGDAVLKSHDDLVKKFLNYGDQVLEHRHCPKSIQIILCAEHWTPQIENILKKLNKVPLVCIGNHLEAALYGKISFTMKFLDTSCKEQNLQKILRDVYKFTKSIIICNPDEVEDITTFLPLKGIEFTAIAEGKREDVRQEDISYNEVAWSNALPGKYSVLVCTDDIYNTMNITNAQLLIHYSLPRSWTQFIRRFSCLLENNPTPLNIKERKENASTFVFIDENCEPRMSKFCNFIKIAGLEKDLPEKIKTFFKGIAMEEEYKRITKNIELCENTKIFGKCDSLHCKKRHVLDKELDHSDILPKNGSIKFKIIKMTSVTTCSIKLLEHFNLKGESVQQFEDFTDNVTELLAKKDNYHYVSKPIENHLYLHKDDVTYCRCKLLEMDEYALVYLIDRGIYVKSDLNRLFKMQDELKKIPPQCYEVHFANLIPPHEDSKFSRSAKHKAQFLVDSNCPNSIMTARVVLQLGNNLWLDDVFEEREMNDKSLPSIGYQLSRELVKQELAVKSDKPLANLYTLCENAGIILPEYKVEKPKIKRVVMEQVKPQWAFLEMDAINQTQFSCGVSPGEFYIKHQKFIEQLAQLEKDIQTEICKPFYPVPQKIEIGKCYLVKDEPTGNYSRGLVLNITDDTAHMFFVDYGDDVVVPISSLKHISNDLILKLPFQSIQCSMYGIKAIYDSWCKQATDFLYKLGFEDGSDTFRTLFVKVCSKQENVVIPRQNSYSVIVKDGFNERRVLLNELLIDCGSAVPNGDEIKDFVLPEKKDESEDEHIEEISRRDEDIAVEVVLDEPIDFDAFDIEIYDVAGFMTDLKFPVRRTDGRKAIEGKNTENELPPMKTAPAVDYFTPEVYWSQTDSNIRLTIKITDVQEPKVTLKHNRIFQFITEKNGQKYQVKLIFYENVLKTFQYSILGPEVRVLLTKCNQEEWPRLQHTEEKAKNVRYDLSTIKDDEKPRKLLELDISDSSSVDDDNDGMVYHVCSDLDSEYDYDIPNDEDE